MHPNEFYLNRKKNWNKGMVFISHLGIIKQDNDVLGGGSKSSHFEKKKT